MAPRNITADQIADTALSSNFRLKLDGELFDFQSSYESYGLKYLGDNTLRFELRDGDKSDWDVRAGASSERNQIGSKTLFANNDPVSVSFNLNIEEGAPNTARWLVLGQLHLASWTGNLTGKSPPVEIGLIGERMVVYGRYDKPDGTVVKMELYSDLHDIDRGHDYNIEIKAVFDPAGNGRLVVVRDGVMLTDYTGTLGYQQQLKVFWGQGIYREGSASETMVAEFGNLAIKTGAAVTFPDKSAFTAAPTWSVDYVGSALSDGSRLATISGSAKAGTTVTFSEEGHVVGRVQVDANGHFTTTLKIAKDNDTPLSAIATDSTGRDGLEAKPQSIIVGTGAEIGAQLRGLVERGDIASIVITDGTVITASSSIFSYIFKYGQEVLSKIQGDFSFFQSMKVSGQAYDTQDFYYDNKGTLLEKVRYDDGVKVFSETYNADGSMHQFGRNAAGGTDVKEINKDGIITFYKQYLPNGQLSVYKTKNPDGSSEIHTYDTKSGLETQYTLTAADGSKEVGALNLKGRAYTTEIYNYNAAGKMIEQHRFDADGTQIFQQTWNADGSRQIDNFNADTGERTSFSVYQANGARVETTLAADNSYAIVKTISYNAAGAVIGVTQGGSLPHPVLVDNSPVPTTPAPTTPLPETSSPVPVPTVPTPTVPAPTVPEVAPKPVEPSTSPTAPKPAPVPPVVEAPPPAPPAAPKIDYVLNTKTGFPAKSTELHSDGTSELLSYSGTVKGLVTARSVVDADGKTLLSETFNAAGEKNWSTVYQADGTKIASQFELTNKAYDAFVKLIDASGRVLSTTFYDDGKIVGVTTFAADGSKLKTDYAADGKATSVRYDADGSVVSKYVYDANGRTLSSDVRVADGSRDVKQFDANGNLAKEVLTHADKSRVESTFGIKDKAYAEQVVEYNSAGKVIEKTRYFDDEKNTVQYSEKYGADGSVKVSNFDALGREISGHTISADKVKDVFVFSYVGTSTDPSRVQHDHYEGAKKMWTEAEDASGNYQQLSFVSGATLESHKDVRDTFTSAGGDTFVFGANAGNDVIWKFSVAPGKQDTLKFDHAGVDSIDDLDIAALGSHTVISYGHDESITLYHVAPAQLKAESFLFV